MTTTMLGTRVRVDGRYGQLNGYNAETRLVTLYSEVVGEGELVFTADAAPVPAQLVCGQCAREASRLFADPRREDDAEGGTERVLCVDCSRSAATQVKRNTPCDRCGASHAWRNPYTRRNEYMCGSCHAATKDGVVLNAWFPRISEPLRVRAREACEGKGVGSACRGEVKPRGQYAHNLCNAHAGRVSAEDPYLERT